MKRTLILAAYVAIGIAGVADGQTSKGNYAPPLAVTTTKETAPAAGPWTKYQTTAILPPTLSQDITPPIERVVMTNGQGGRIVEHRLTFEGYFRSGTKVELRGPCYSACTLLLAYMEKANLCVAPAAFMAFHAARGEKKHDYLVGETRAMYESYPPEVRRWIDHNGGWHNLPLDGFWTMYDHTLWSLGYPRCSP